MREIASELITETVERLCVEACTYLGGDMKAALRKAKSEETSPAARAAMEDIVNNFECAASEGLPICQDTGMTVVFADIGQDAHITDWAKVKNTIRDDLGGFVWKRTKRRPMILPIIMEA